MTKNTQLLLSAFCAFFLTSDQLFAEIKLPAIFGNNMVLQRETDVAIWGTADTNASVSVITSWNDKKYETKADSNGRFKLKVSTPKAGGPYNVTISDGTALTLENVLIGEVWLCSGQSNMQMPMRGYNNQPVIGSLDAILESENPNLRLFNVVMSASPTPKDTFRGKWNMAEPETTAAFSATAYFYGRLLQKTLKVPVGLIVASWGGTTIQPWMNDEACKEFEFYKNIKRDTPLPKLPAPKMPTSLFNAMINPMVGYGIRGAIWYQGESNKWEPEAYQRMFPAMIKGWRNVWGQGDFPFYYAQCAPHGKNDVLPNGGFLRESQLKTLTAVPNVGMAVTMDLGEQFCIHPSSKEEGSKRLAYLALSETYGIKGISPYSPVFKEMTIKNDTAIITFDKAPDGLSSFGKELSLFEVAGADKVFYPAKATILRNNATSTNYITVKSDSVKEPVAVRYAYKNFVVGDLFGNNGVPVSSFRTDDWVRDK